MQRYALIDNCSGDVWGVTDADSPENAAHQLDAELGEGRRHYEQGGSPPFSNETGYHVYTVPAGFEVQNGQDQDEIGAVESNAKAAYLRVVEADA